MRSWIEPSQTHVPEPLKQAVGGHPLVAQTLVRRGVTDPEIARAFLDARYYQPSDPHELPGMEQAVQRIAHGIEAGETICVWGDFDVDGQTSTALLVSTLKDLGARVTYHIPIREKESHGVNVPMLASIVEDGASLVLTCDTGITAHEAVEFARERKVDFIITDHHELPDELPPARATINPKLLPGDHPLSNLPGVGVAYKLAEALYEQAGRKGEATKYLDLVALGIVADVAIQTGDTRYLLQNGLKALRNCRRLGLQIMMELAGITPLQLTEEHLAFSLGPRLNAVGRLADANVAVEFLTTQDPRRARLLATQLEGLNARRKLLTDQVFASVQAQLERNPNLLNQSALVLSHPGWPAGVVGIVASRLVERYHRPVALISAPEGKLARGSARSVDGCNITAAIASQRDLLVGFGGHAMAAGFSLQPEQIPQFRRGLALAVQEILGGAIAPPDLQIDGAIALAELTLQFVADLERLAPFGAGNPPLTLLAERLKLQKTTSLGRNDEHLLLQVLDENGNQFEIIWWQGGGWPTPDPLKRGAPFDLAYVPRSSDYRGERAVQVEWVDARPSERTSIGLPIIEQSVAVQDYRSVKNPLSTLQSLLAKEDAEIWCEAEAKGWLLDHGIDGHNLGELKPSATFFIWTSPPGPQELRAALERVSPKKVFVFAIPPQTDNLGDFLKRLAGLLKYAATANMGRASVLTLASAMAQRPAAIRAGIEWLEARGYIQSLALEGDEVSFKLSDSTGVKDASRPEAQLKEILAETSAYRNYFSKVSSELLVSMIQEVFHQDGR